MKTGCSTIIILMITLLVTMLTPVHGVKQNNCSCRTSLVPASPTVVLQPGTQGNAIISTNSTNAIVTVAAPVSDWGLWSGELLTNSGFEMGNLTGWVAMGPAAANVGVFSSTSGGDIYTNKSLRIGNYGVCTKDTPGTNDSSGVWQNVSLGTYASAIDTGKAVINASAWLYPSEWDWDDVALIIRFYNSSGGFISAWNTTGEYGSGTAYYPKACMLGMGYSHFTQGQLKQFGCYNYTIPVGTRTVGIQLGMGEHKDAANWCGGQADEASVKIRTKSSAASYDYVLKLVNKVTNAWNTSLVIYSSSNIDRLLNATIVYHDGTSSNQIVITNGTVTQSVGQLYNLPGGNGTTIYISVSNLLASTTATSYLYVYLGLFPASSSPFNVYRITFQVT